MAAVTGDLVSAPGAALAAPGPGVAAAATGVARATLDRSPMILVTDRHPGSVHGCKASLAVDAGSASRWTAHAAQLAMNEPRGPVHLDVPAEVSGAPAVPAATACRPAPLPPPDPRALDEAARLLANASRPVLIAGLQCRSATDAQWLRALAEALPAPVLLTLRAKGVLPDPHPLMHGVLWPGGGEGPLLGRADLIVALGLDAIEVSPGPWMTTAPLLHLAPSPAAGEWHRPVVEVVGDIALAIEELAPRLRGRARADWDVAELDRVKRSLRPRPGAGDGRLTPERVAALAPEATELVRMGQRFAVPSAAADSEASFAQAFGRALRAEGPALIAAWS